LTAEADPGIKILGARLLMTASRQYRDYFESNTNCSGLTLVVNWMLVVMLHLAYKLVILK